MRLLRSRTIAHLLVGALVCGGLGVVLTADPPRRAALRLTDGGAWLVHRPSGVLTHVNGLSGRADAAVPLAGAAGHPIQVVDADGHLLAVDGETGVVHRVDPTRLTVTATLDTGSPDTRLFVADGDAYVVVPADAHVQRVDPVHLTPLGSAVEFPSVGGAGQTPDGTLWVTVPTEGAAVPVVDGVPGEPVAVAPADPDPADGDLADGDLAVVVVGDTAAVVDRPARRVAVVERGHSSPVGSVLLPPNGLGAGDGAGGEGAGGGEVVVPAAVSSGNRLPVLLAGGSQRDGDGGHARVVVTVDVDNSPPVVVTTTELPDADADAGPGAGRFGAPLAHAGQVYLPRDDHGDVWRVDLATNELTELATVTDPAGGESASPPRLTLFAKDDDVWVDNQAGTAAAVVSGGVVRPVSKDAEGLAGLEASGPPRPLPTPTPTLPPATAPAPAPLPVTVPAPAPDRLGYWLAFSDGSVQAAGTATGVASGTPGVPDRVVGVAASAAGRGYWLVDARGRAHPFGDAPDLAPRGTSGAVVAVAAAPTGGGFWTVTAAGHVTPFGTVVDHGSPPQPVADPVVGIAATATGGGYWLVDTTGRVQAFGDAAQPTPTGAFRASVTAIAATAHGLGYLVAAADGEVAVVDRGRVRRESPREPVPSRVVGVASTSTSAGYWLADASGAVVAAGDAARFDVVDAAGRAAVGIAAVR